MFVFNSPAFIEAGLSNIAWRPGAVSANINGFTLSTVKVMSLVLFARGVWDTLHEGILEDITWISTIAVTTSLTVDNNLSIESNWGWVLVLEENVESISKSRGGSLSPA